jgi:hypothetical protein
MSVHIFNESGVTFSQTFSVPVTPCQNSPPQEAAPIRCAAVAVVTDALIAVAAQTTSAVTLRVSNTLSIDQRVNFSLPSLRFASGPVSPLASNSCHIALLNGSTPRGNLFLSFRRADGSSMVADFITTFPPPPFDERKGLRPVNHDVTPTVTPATIRALGLTTAQSLDFFVKLKEGGVLNCGGGGSCGIDVPFPPSNSLGGSCRASYGVYFRPFF